MTGLIQQASVHQTIQYLGESFTIRRKVATGYDAATSTATPADTAQTVKGIQDDGRQGGLGVRFGQATDVRTKQRAVIIPAKDLTFIPGIGDGIESGTLRDSIREVQELKGPEGVPLSYRLVLENG